MKIPITLLLLLLATTSFAQPLTPGEELYKILSTHKIIPSTHKETAKKDLEDYITKYPTNPYSLIARFWLGEIHHNLNEVDSSTLYYIQAIDIPAPDSVYEANGYKHFSAIRLAEIYLARGDYSATLKYLDLAKNKFIFRPHGKLKVDPNTKINVMYSSCYIELNKSREAIDLLSPDIFGRYRGDTTVSNKLYEAYLKMHTKEEIKNEFLNAEKRLEIKEEKIYDGSYLLKPTLIVFGKTISFDVYTLTVKKLTEQEQKQKCMETIRQSAIYKLATG
jgi:hypothetical protein